MQRYCPTTLSSTTFPTEFPAAPPEAAPTITDKIVVAVAPANAPTGPRKKAPTTAAAVALPYPTKPPVTAPPTVATGSARRMRQATPPQFGHDIFETDIKIKTFHSKEMTGTDALTRLSRDAWNTTIRASSSWKGIFRPQEYAQLVQDGSLPLCREGGVPPIIHTAENQLQS